MISYHEFLKRKRDTEPPDGIDVPEGTPSNTSGATTAKADPSKTSKKPDGTYAASSTTAKRSHGRNARPASSPGYAAKPKPTASNTNTAYGETSHSETPTPPSPTSTSS